MEQGEITRSREGDLLTTGGNQRRSAHSQRMWGWQARSGQSIHEAESRKETRNIQWVEGNYYKRGKKMRRLLRG